jgi:hypothetical protein
MVIVIGRFLPSRQTKDGIRHCKFTKRRSYLCLTRIQRDARGWDYDHSMFWAPIIHVLT